MIVAVGLVVDVGATGGVGVYVLDGATVSLTLNFVEIGVTAGVHETNVIVRIMITIFVLINSFPRSIRFTPPSTTWTSCKQRAAPPFPD